MEDAQDSDFRVRGDVLWKYSLARLFSWPLDYCLLGKHSCLVTRDCSLSPIEYVVTGHTQGRGLPSLVQSWRLEAHG